MDKGAIKRALKYILHGVPTTSVSLTVKNIVGKRLAGKQVLITGGSKGIGYWIAEKCIEEGAKTIICGRNEQTLISAQEQLGESCKCFQFDVSDIDGIPAFLNRVYEEVGTVDCLVNNAGISFHEGSFRNVTSDGFDKQFAVNFKGSYFMAKYFIEKVEHNKQKGANVLFITSERGSFGTTLPYGLSKAAINNYVKALSHYLCGNENIRINALAPGVCASEMTGIALDGDYYSLENPMGRIFHPAEMANVACFLLSDESSCISGEVIHCDAGHHQNVID